MFKKGNHLGFTYLLPKFAISFCMKHLKLFVTTLFFLISADLFSQMPEPARANFNFIDLLNYTTVHSWRMMDKIKENIDEGKLPIYKDSGLKELHPLQDFYDNLYKKRYVKISNPMNPDDIYDLIDTFIYEGLYYPSELCFQDNSALKLEYSNGMIVYVSLNKVRKQMDKYYNNIIDYYLAKNFTTITGKGLIDFCKSEIRDLGIKFYNYGISGQLKAYRYDSLTTTYTIEEILDRVSIKVNTQHPNPNNPDDIYDLIDSVTTYGFNPDTIDVLRIYSEWEAKESGAEITFTALAPMFKPVAAGLQLPYTPIFNLKFQEVFKRMPKTEKLFWQHFFTFFIYNRSSTQVWDIYTEADFQIENEELLNNEH